MQVLVCTGLYISNSLVLKLNNNIDSNKLAVSQTSDLKFMILYFSSSSSSHSFMCLQNGVCIGFIVFRRIIFNLDPRFSLKYDIVEPHKTQM